MFYHVVMMKFNAKAGEAFHRKVEEYSERLRTETAGLIYYDYTANIASRSKGYDRVIVSVFESSAAHDAYQVSATHQEMKAFMTPFFDDLVVCDSDVAVPAKTLARRD